LSACRSEKVDGAWEWNTVRQLTGSLPDARGLHLDSLRVLDGPGENAFVAPKLEELRTSGSFLRWSGEWEDKPGQHWGTLSVRRLVFDGWTAWCLPSMTPMKFFWLWRHVPKLRELDLPNQKGSFVLTLTRGADGLSQLHVEGTPQKIEYDNVRGAVGGDAETLIAAIAALPEDALTACTFDGWRPSPGMKAALARQRSLRTT
jgi:hypothetical protein